MADLAAGVVPVQDGRARLAGQPSVSPADHHHEHFHQVQAHLGERVLMADRAGGVFPALKHTGLGEPFEPFGEHLTGYAKALLQLVAPECSVAARAPGIDIVVEGATSWVSDRAVAEEVGAAYIDKYGWPVTLADENMFDAPYGAPTAGPPPYRVYEIAPRLAYAFGTGDDLGVRSTRFRFTGI